LGSDRLSTFSQVVLRFYEIAQQLPVHAFQDAALGAIKAILPFDSSMWGSATMSEQGVDIHTLHLHHSSRQMIEEYGAVKHLDHFAHEVASKEIHTIRFSAENAQAEELRAFLFRHEHLHGLITQCINPQTRFVQWLSLFRKDPEQCCTEQDVQVLDALFPHLMQALAINRKLHMMHLVGDSAHERWSVAIADHHGFLYHADPTFLRLIATSDNLVDRERLPAHVMDAFSQPVFQLTRNQVVLVGVQESDLLFLKARPTVLADQLNPREFTIAQMLASGLSHKEIAQKLNRSPETIRTHGKSIYKKLGTTKVTQLSALLAQRA
jgi:DNA-binding CsgD family transcriptional regulator